MTSCLLSWTMQPFKIGSTLTGKNLLIGEQILFFKSWSLMRCEAKMKIKELLPLKDFHFFYTNLFPVNQKLWVSKLPSKVYPFTLWWMDTPAKEISFVWKYICLQGAVVQSVVSLTNSLRGQLVKYFTTLLLNTLIFFVKKMREAFAVQKLLTLFQQKYWQILDINIWKFNETLTNYVVSFEQPGPVLKWVLIKDCVCSHTITFFSFKNRPQSTLPRPILNPLIKQLGD